MRRILTLLLVFGLLTACTANEGNAIEKADHVTAETSDKAEPVLSEMEEEMDEYIEFNLDGEQISLNISNVPILYEFLRVQQNPEQTKQGLHLEKLENDNHDVFVLPFSCNNDLCSYLLFNRDQNKQPFLVADLAHFVNSSPSPDQSKIVMQFNRTGNETTILSNVVVFDLVKWQPLSIKNEETTHNLLNYTWPFVSVEWLDDESLGITIPDLLDPNKELYNEWSTTEENSVTTATFTIESE